MTHRHGGAHPITEGYSLEVGTKDLAALSEAAPRIPRGSLISIPYLARESDDARLSAARAVRRLGFAPMPHLAARRVGSRAALQTFVERAVNEAGVERCFLIAGDPAVPVGPFSDSAALIDTGVFERAGIKVMGVAGHPDSHPTMSEAQRWDVLARKCRHIEQRGMAPQIVTQFAFDADVVLAWLSALRERGMAHPVRVGVPGPAGVRVLARYAAVCGVRACASMWSQYGLSMGKLLGTPGPDHFVDRLSAGLNDTHGEVALHFFPFGGVTQSLTWIEQHRARGLSGPPVDRP